MIINSKTALGGATYPFLQRLGQPWMIHTWDVDADQQAVYNAPIALRWINETTVNDLYVQAMDTAEFLAATGLCPQMTKGGFVLSKRISRLMRPYFMYGFFDRSTLTVQYLEQSPRTAKVWDGAGRVRRSVLLRVLEQMPELPTAKKMAMAHELRHARRIEFTLMGLGQWSDHTSGGQDKGHLIVFEDDELDADFVLPRDTKHEITLEDGSVFVGFYPVHHADTMRLDIQSLINLWGFFRHDDLVQWLHEEGDLFLHSTQDGRIARAMRRIDQTDVNDDDEALEAIKNWHIREYLASGGDPLWFGSIVKGLINQHLKRINYSTLGRLRLPIPGGRYYVMTDEVGACSIAPGHIKLDAAASTAWINAEDWVRYAADVWGGADQDDALWVYPFTDYDGHQQILAWRSPNQLGEYVVLQPTADSDIPVWYTRTTTRTFPSADSRDLPPRIDTINVRYQNLIDPDTAGGLGEWLDHYSVAGMRFALQRARANRGALGHYCNLLMLARALYNQLPAQPPAPLEAVIDGSVKTGTDLAPIKHWCNVASRLIVEQGKPISARLQDRLSVSTDKGQPVLMPTTSTDHWFDQLINAIEAHITFIEGERDMLMQRCRPPLAVFNMAYQSEEVLQMGARFNQVYTASLPWVHRHGRSSMSIQEALDQARQRSTDYLTTASQGDARTQQRILLAAAARYYANPQHVGKDEAIWQLGPRALDGTRLDGIAQHMIQALRQLGVLNELAQLENGYVVRYPGARQLDSVRQPIKIVGVWFNYWRFIAAQRGLAVPERMQDVTAADEQWAKAKVEELANTQFNGLRLTIRHENGRAIADTPQGNIFGYIAKDHTALVANAMTLRFALCRDGNYFVIYC